jgi:hypothetical protein
MMHGAFLKTWRIPQERLVELDADQIRACQRR